MLNPNKPTATAVVLRQTTKVITGDPKLMAENIKYANIETLCWCGSDASYSSKVIMSCLLL
jgi:hypothetical protein